MNLSLEELQQRLRTLRLAETASYLPNLIHQAESEDWTYRRFLDEVTTYEQKRRDEKQIEKRLKWASFPFHKTIDDFHLQEQQDNREANLFFHLINDLYDKSSIILTSNKAPDQWGELLGDPGITTAILDRIIHRSEVIHFRNDDSYRMKHRTSIFGEQSVQN